MGQQSNDEFPLLAAYSLYAAEIRGDGNCLFNALSDQLYGHQNEHHKIRARVIQYMRDHADYYKQFIDVHPGGGLRRNPKRKNAGVHSTPARMEPPTPEQIDRVFENHLASMAKGGTFGDNMEIQAFASAYGVDVKIYQHDFAYLISSPEPSDTGAPRPVAHIAYHLWEHYSSIRNVDGPHTGLPNVHQATLTPEEEARNREAAAKVSYVLPWMVQVVEKSLPYLADKETIKKTLEEYKGNINDAVSKLMDAEDRASVSSQQGGSSTERDPDSDDESYAGPSKKQDRRMSRASKAKKAETEKTQRPNTGSHTVVAKTEPTEVPEHPPNTMDLPLRTAKPSIEKADALEHVDAMNHHDKHTSADTKTTQMEKSSPQDAAVTSQKQPGPQRKRPTARDRKEMKKAAQKAARKESKRNAAQDGAHSSRHFGSETTNVQSKVPTSEFVGIKTLVV